MKLALLGRGRMGREVEKQAASSGHEIVLWLDGRSNPGGAGLTKASLAGVEVAIDFTRPEAVLDHVARLAAAGVPMVVGTTGWYDELPRARALVEEAGGALVYGANFSVGANLFLKMVGEAARLFDRFAEYDPYVVEHHHRAKRDAPSGTALRLAESILAGMSRKSRIQIGPPAGAMEASALHVASVRAGEAFGRHLVGFDAAADAVEIVHCARGREGFARGALHAAEWIKARRGFYEFLTTLEEE